MNRKFQVFISSTYRDLLTERQTAVQAVLDAGHIPAGMELFAAGDEAQLAVVKRWIDDSDIYMLILGVRYGFIEPTTKKSYTHVEYDYAVAQGKPVFAVYLADKPFAERAKELALEVVNEDRKGYTLFRDLVKSKICSEFSDPRDITIAVFKALSELARKSELQQAGWIRGRDVPDPTELLVEKAQFTSEIARLATELVRVTAERDSLLAKSSAPGNSASEGGAPIALTFGKNSYWRGDPGTGDGPFCTRCWDAGTKS